MKRKDKIAAGLVKPEVSRYEAKRIAEAEARAARIAAQREARSPFGVLKTRFNPDISS